MLMKILLCLSGIIYGVWSQVAGQNGAVLPQQPQSAPPDTPDPVNFTAKPGGTHWPGLYNNGNNERSIFADWLINGDWSPGFRPPKDTRTFEYEGYDGWYNNIARPDSGAVDRPLLRRWPAAYKDGTYLPSGYDRPNPLDLSDQLLNGTLGKKSVMQRNTLFLFFGQQVVEEILDAQRAACPPEYFNIKIPADHKYKKTNPKLDEMPILRTRFDMTTGLSPNNPRQQLNEITPYLDGGLFYGVTKQWSDLLRTYINGTVDPRGRLASSEDGLFPENNTARLPMANPPPPFYHDHYTKVHELAPVERFFKLGNPRGNENAFLLSFGIMWFRWHNYLAERFHHHHPDWNREKIYNEARKWVIATQQQIVFYEWLPVLLGESMTDYTHYDVSIDPQIDQFFQSAAFRFGHTMVVPGVRLRGYLRENCTMYFKSWTPKAVRTCNIFWRPQEPILSRTNDSKSYLDIDRLLMGMSVQLTEKEDHEIVEDLRGNVFGPLEFPRRDLMAVNIQRGRDHGLPDFNSARRAYGLEPYKNFGDFKHITEEVRGRLMDLYNNSIDHIDVWVGGILETDRGPGELFKTIIKDQFRRIRDGDRFWFENKRNGLFNENEIARIKNITIYDVLMAVTKMDYNDIPKKSFRVPNNDKHNDELRANCPLRGNETTGYYLEPLNAENLLENCTEHGSYDYFSNSEVSFIVTFTVIGTCILGTIGFVIVLIRLKEKEMVEMNTKLKQTKRQTLQSERIHYPHFIVNEWTGPNLPTRTVFVKFKTDSKQITVTCLNGTILRALDFNSSDTKPSVKIYVVTDRLTLILNTTHNYDLVLLFETDYLRNNFLVEFENCFVQSNTVEQKSINLTWTMAQKAVITKENRQKRLDMFFRVVFAQAFKIEHSNTEILKVDAYVAKEVVDTELTIVEFADSLSMKSNNEFIKRMFTLIDKDKNGFISFREFVDLIIIFADGTEEQKAKLLFDMYDVDGIGYLKQEDFITMIKSFLETVGGNIEDEDIHLTVNHMLKNAGVEHKKNKLTFEDFKNMIGEDIKNLNTARLGFKGYTQPQQKTYLDEAKDVIENIYESKQEIEARFKGQSANVEEIERNSKIIDQGQEEVIKTTIRNDKPNEILRYIELKSREIFWITLYTLILFCIFFERAYYYTVEREHSGLRRIAGYGVTITRGAASAMMFTYSSLLVTMCRNTLTYLRETFANGYFPFDSSVEIHKYISLWGFIFTLVHIIGHAFNFYHISTQTADDLTCLFRNYFHATHVLPKFHYWCWQTMTGFTGVILTLIWAIMYIFALPIIRRKIYNWFWYTHNLYPLFYIFFILHGTGRLIQAPFTFYFLLAPLILFTLDSLISISRKKVEIPVIHAEVLPSGVTMLEFQKPENFQHKAGQWVRLACMGLNKNEYHPFTLSSAPDEDNLTVHIRAVGPWTNLIRKTYEDAIRDSTKYSKLYLDGPYGEGHQDWNTYDVAILIGGGIGVTPFASILKDVAYKANKLRTHCKKVYFIWVSRTQKQFEWMVDIIREVENKDTKQFVSCHIFITQFYEKFDLRTILLYICERHYQRVANKSLFTNLRAVTHFGRPAFAQFFKTVQSIHETSKRIGVFSCGPPSMTSSVDSACSKINQQGHQKFEHHFKNF